LEPARDDCCDAVIWLAIVQVPSRWVSTIEVAGKAAFPSTVDDALERRARFRLVDINNCRAKLDQRPLPSRFIKRIKWLEYDYRASDP
jgi:hypothetical protein